MSGQLDTLLPGLSVFMDNPEPRCPVIILCDTSASMRENGKIDSLNEGLQLLADALKEDQLARLRVELAVVRFGPDVEMLDEFTTADKFTPPYLTANGGTPMGEAILGTLATLEERKSIYKSSGTAYFRPWVFMLTDGYPTDNWQDAAYMVHQMEQKKAVAFFAVGVDHNADMNVLRQICSPERPPLSLKGLDFSSMFQWLSSSLAAVSHSQPGQQTALPPVGWASV